MYKILLSLALAIIILLPKSVFAIFAIDKTFLLLDDHNRNETITIYNNSDYEHDYFVFLDHYKQNKKGDYVEIAAETKELKFADNYLLYTPIKFTIKKHSSQVVRLQKRSMAKANQGEYISYVTIKEHPNTQEQSIRKSNNKVNFVLTPIFNISLPIIVRKGNLQSTFDISKVKLLKKNNQYTLATTINIKGKKSVRGNLKITYNKEVIAEIKDINVFAYAGTKTILYKVKSETLKKYNKKYLKVSFSAPDGEKSIPYFNIM